MCSIGATDRILRGGRARDRDQGLAGRVRDEMQVKEIAALRHRGEAVDRWGEGHALAAQRKHARPGGLGQPRSRSTPLPLWGQAGLDPPDMVNKWKTGGHRG